MADDNPRLPQRFENPARCGICFAPWLFDTDELGRVHHRHPPKKCVAPTYAEEREYDIDRTTAVRYCAECKVEMPVRKKGGGKNRTTCGDVCRKRRNTRMQRDLRERDRLTEDQIKKIWKAVA